MLSWLIVVTAQAQVVPDMSAQLYRPPIDAEGTLWADTSGHIVDPQARARAVLQYLNRPFVWVESAESTEGTALVSDALQLDAIGSYHIGRFRFGLDVPVYLFSAGQQTQNGAGLGDVAIDARLTAVDGAEAPVGFAFTARGFFPTTTVDAPLGSPNPGAEFGGVLDGRFGKTLLVSNIGTRILPPATLANVELNDQLLFRLGGGYSVTDNAGLSVDMVGQVNYSAKLSNPAGAPIEAIVGGWGRVSDDFVMRGGVGRGITPGIGSPSLRVVTMFGYEPAAEADQDGDGYVDTEDGCPLRPEDFDGFQDLDGCPDLSQLITVKVVDSSGAVIPGAQSALSGDHNTSVSGAKPGRAA
jgi:hypothetical protein